MNIHTRTSAMQVAAAATAAVLLIGACSRGSKVESTVPPTTSSIVQTTSTITTTSELATAAETIDIAVDRLVEAGSYAFEAKLLVSFQGEPTEVEEQGWVDGSDSELVMTIDRQSVTTRVIDGVATVERDGETVEVPLEEAGQTPSILILKEIQSPAIDTPTTITGKLNASSLAETGFDINGSATIKVTVGTDGYLVGYTIEANNNSWSVDVKLKDIGENPKT